tara:strand:+ start:257 stop:664 length:408 start_codon:yes stop_codon:yes gene_type:complete
MKTFQEFILEATIQELRAKAKMLRQKGDMKGALEVEMQAGELQAGTQAKIGALTGDRDKKDERENTWVSGKASKPKDTRARGGSLANIPSSDGEGDDTSTGGRFGDRRSGRSGGVRGQSRNNATARNLGHLGSKS